METPFDDNGIGDDFEVTAVDADGAIEVDFSEAVELAPLEPGRYTVQCNSCKAGTSKAGFKKWDWSWKVIEGPMTNRLIFDSLSFHPKALGRSKTVLKQLGVPVEGRVALNPVQVLNKVAVARVSLQPSTQTDPDTGELYPPRNRINSFKVVSNPDLV